ncbi:uncharacterized protein LOC143857628 [Tasmannia lanceolata]|uniref:uncharacterized protein LOC143857628 n=1 Tax=Tasmannia lanceolata TaxID=3420 RepID=UPI0040648B5E
MAIIAWAKAKTGIPYSVGDILRMSHSVTGEYKRVEKITTAWKPPSEGFFKFNFDGCSFGNPGAGGISDVIRDGNGNTIMSFSGPAGLCDANEAEARPLLFGLRWFNLHKLGPLIVEGDSSNSIAWAASRCAGPWKLTNILDEIRDLMRSIHPQLVHMHRSMNSTADALAKDGARRAHMDAIVDESLIRDC